MTLFAIGVLLILMGGTAAVVLSSRPRHARTAFVSFLVAGCSIASASAIGALFGVPVAEVGFTTALPVGPWVFGMDVLSALFVVAIAFVGAASALYGVSSLGHHASPRRVGIAHMLMAVLIAALVLMVTARAVLPFLVAWELMAISAYLLIVFDAERADVRRAGLIYVVAAHTSLLALLALFAVWGESAEDLTFAALSASAPLPAATATGVLVLALFGFGLKAGMVPLHFWLPSAHAAAPPHVSAMLSGVVIKAGVYGLMRVIVMMGVSPAWFGWMLLASGLISGVLGVLWALAQHEIKHLLAFHSVENIGIILIGLGAGVLGMAYENPLMAVLGFAGAALHTVNHALFKSLLFLGAGSVIHATAQREIDRLGGLATRMPVTAAAFLIGSAAIVGLPPLNGFLSEWLVFRSLLAGQAGDASRLAALGVAGLGLIGALALACFAKVVGVLFLGRTRGPLPSDVCDPASGQRTAMLALAGACILIGITPVLVVPPVTRVGSFMAGIPVVPGTGAAAVSLTVLGGFVLIGCALVALVLASVRRRGVQTRAGTWACGFPAVSARMQYTASSFAAPVLAPFRGIVGMHVSRSSGSFATHSSDPIMDRAVPGTWQIMRALADRLRPIQQGRLSLYLLYIVATLVLLLGWLTFGGGAA